MPLFGSEALQVVQEVNACLLGAFVQKISAPTPREAFLELRLPGKSWLLVLSADTHTGRLAVAKERPLAAGQPQSIQQAMRKQLLGAKLLEARAQAGLWLLWQKGEKRWWLWANWKEGYLALGEAEGAWRSFSSRPEAGGPRVGMPCMLPPFEEDSRVSRLAYTPGEVLGALHAAAVLFEREAQAKEERAWLKPLKARLARLQKTMAKVHAEAERLSQVEQLEAEAQALVQNMAKLKRGMSSVSLEVFCSDGRVETRELKLNPAKTPREEMEARFQKAKRLRRGMGIAKARLRQLEAEAEVLRQHIDSGIAPEEAATKPLPPLPKTKPAPSLPYRAYVSAAGQPIWVGRGARHNEALSFQLAKPWQLWLHARGQSGAHVLLPLGRNEEAKPETLLDAAHLAWHFSDGNKEPVGEVSYVEARYVRKPKGKAGAVLLTQEKTLRLRVEKARLDRLLSRPVSDRDEK